MKLNNILLWVAVLVIAGWLFYPTLQGEEPQLGSVTVGNEYTATSTANVITGVAADRAIKDGWGALGSVIVLDGSGTATYQLLNASSTVMTNTAFSTSSNLLAEIPAGVAAGTYTFDVTFTDGLYLDLVSVGTLTTSTITFR